ncbi:MAG: hypothetical protein ABL984_02930 [Pyrinomonadaceae bacterium]
MHRLAKLFISATLTASIVVSSSFGVSPHSPAVRGEKSAESVATDTILPPEQNSEPIDQQASTVTSDVAFGLSTTTFDTLVGTVTVNLPDDLAAGDTISGTVIAEVKKRSVPADQPPADQTASMDELSGYVVEVAEQETPVKKADDKVADLCTDPADKSRANLIDVCKKWSIPDFVSKIPVVLKNSAGKVMGRADVPVSPKASSVAEQVVKPKSSLYSIPQVGQSGRPIPVKGSFDGDFKSTSVKIENAPAKFLASSPRKLIVHTRSTLNGPSQIQLEYKGKLVAKCSYRSISIRLAADKLNLLKGEQTTLTVTLAGLTGMPSADAKPAPISIQLTNKSPHVVSMAGGETQNIPVDPAQVTGDTFATKRTLTGVKAGGFSISAIVDPAKMVPVPCGSIPDEIPKGATPDAQTAYPAPAASPNPGDTAPDQCDETPGRNWDFEEGRFGWTPTGTAFSNQPTLGDNVVASRVRTDMMLAAGGVGGDYWWRIPYPIGHHLNYWVGTYEDHPDATRPLGRNVGNAGIGTLTSGYFPLDDEHRFIAFVVAGGRDVTTERVELQVRGNDEADLAEVERLVGANRGGYSALAAALFGGTPEGSRLPLRDGCYVVALTASGQDSEVMRPVVFEVPASLRGRRGRIRIVDNAREAWGHINVDDFRFGSTRPPDRVTPVWGFADTHAHPMNDLAFGGNLIQGSLHARDGSTYASERYRRTALPTMFDSVGRPQLGPLGTLLSPMIGHRAILDSARLIRSGYPEMQGYPTTSQMAGQTVYSEWVRRAYDGGLRLMSALTVNTWVISSHPVKRLALGSTQPESDAASSDVQVADVKAWALRPENRTWVEVAFTPADARRIIGANKLAIVIGVELDSLGNFVPNNNFREPGAIVMPTDATEQRRLISKELDRLYAQGVRQIGPLHYVSGVWGGAAMSQRFFNDINRGVTGNNVDVASGDAEGIRYRLDMDGWGPSGVLTRTALTGDAPGRHHGENWERTGLGHINAMGLLPAGEILFDEMARRGLLIDVDHASHRSVEGMLALARARDYPLMSSHSDYNDLGFTGPGRFSFLGLVYHDDVNLGQFDTTIQDPLRNERMITRTSVQTIASLGGVTGAIMWLPRRTGSGTPIPNDCDGSSKTWAQAYQYAVETTGGRGVALSTDRITVYPRFGPNAAFPMGAENTTMPRRDERRFRQLELQHNGVRYDTPLREWGAYRFKLAIGTSGAWQKTPVRDLRGVDPDPWESRPVEMGDAWMAVAANAAGRNPRMMPTSHGIDGGPRVIDYAWGLGSRLESDVTSDGVLQQTGALHSRYAAYCAKNGRLPSDLRSLRFDVSVAQIWNEYWWVKRALGQWQRMTGTNEPLRRYLFGYRQLGSERVDRDFDVNIDGVAHYGMLPDFLQDVANSHPRAEEVGTYLDPLFRSAESYIRMWEKTRMTAGLRDGDR